MKNGAASHAARWLLAGLAFGVAGGVAMGTEEAAYIVIFNGLLGQVPVVGPAPDSGRTPEHNTEFPAQMELVAEPRPFGDHTQRLVTGRQQSARLRKPQVLEMLHG